MAVSEESQQYTIKWEAKPLGFSIVMDTTGRNAYVSSIQKQENLKKGLKLAAQIVKINDENAKGLKHAQILSLIKNAQLPMRLTFQPRSFASNNTSEASTSATEELPKGLLFGGAPEGNERVNGLFLLVKNELFNGRAMWQRKDDEEDPILLWYWPTAESTLKHDLWMIGRKSRRNSQGAYACVPSSVENPLHIDGAAKWSVYEKAIGKFKECKLHIAADVDAAEESLNDN